MRAPAVLLVSCALLLAGCAEGGDTVDLPPTGATAPPTTAAATGTAAGAAATTTSVTGPPSTAPPASVAGATTSTSGPSQASATTHLVAVTVAPHDGFDRVVFTFREDRPPGYATAYAAPPLSEDGSGRPVDVAGEVALTVRMEPASGYDMDASAPTYRGPKRVRAAGTAAVTEVVDTGDFEAVLSWGIGLRARRPARVFTLTNPGRIVVDVTAG